MVIGEKHFDILNRLGSITGVTDRRIDIHRANAALNYVGRPIQETHQEMRRRTWTFFTTTSHMYYKSLRPLPAPNCTTRRSYSAIGSQASKHNGKVKLRR